MVPGDSFNNSIPKEINIEVHKEILFYHNWSIWEDPQTWKLIQVLIKAELDYLNDWARRQ